MTANTTLIRRFLPSLFCWFVLSPSIHAQQFDLLIKSGHVIDPKNQVDSVMDVAITTGKIAKLGADIPATQAKKTVNAAGLLRDTPRPVDIHAHVFWNVV